MNTMPFRRILVGWDASPGARAAVRAALGLAGEEGQVVAVTVAPDKFQGEYHEDAGDADGPARMERDLATLARELRAQPPELRVVTGKRVAEALCEYAREHGFSLVAVGRHGEGGLLHPARGHVASTLARLDTVSVLVVDTS